MASCDSIESLLNQLVNEINDLKSKQPPDFLSQVIALIEALKGLVLGLISELRQFVTDQLQGMRDFIQSKINAVKEVLLAVIEAIRSLLDGETAERKQADSQLSTRMAALEERVSKNEAEFAEVSAKVAGLAGVVFGVAGALAALDGKVKVVEAELLGLKGEVLGKIAALEVGLAANYAIDGVQTGAIAFIQAEVLAVGGGLAALSGTVAANLALDVAQTGELAVLGAASAANVAVDARQEAALAALAAGLATALACCNREPEEVQIVYVDRPVLVPELVPYAVPTPEIVFVPQPAPYPVPYVVPEIVPYPVPAPYPVTTIVPYEIPVTNTVYIDRPVTTIVPVAAPYPVTQIERVTETQLVPLVQTNTITKTETQVLPVPVPAPYPVTEIVPYGIPVTNTVYVDRPSVQIERVTETQIVPVTQTNTITKTETQVVTIEKPVIVTQTDIREIEKPIVITRAPTCEELRDCIGERTVLVPTVEPICQFTASFGNMFDSIGNYLPITFSANVPSGNPRCNLILAPAVSGVGAIANKLKAAVESYINSFESSTAPTIERIGISQQTANLINGAITQLNNVPLNQDSAVPAVESLAQQVLANLLSQETNAIAAVPEWWEMRPEYERPQLCVLFGLLNEKTKKIGGAMYQITIPHYKGEKPTVSPLPQYKKGSNYGILTLNDNSKVIVYAYDQKEAQRVLEQAKKFISPAQLSKSNTKVGSMNTKKARGLGTLVPKEAHYYPKGLSEGAKPEWVQKFKTA